MGDWQPQRTIRARGPDREHTIYFWLVPANAEGTWDVTLRTAAGVAHEAMLRLTQRLTGLEGELQTAEARTPISGGRVSGAEIAFTAGDSVWRGRVAGDTAAGRAGDTQEWTARRRR
jgi:hypothetical protein